MSSKRYTVILSFTDGGAMFIGHYYGKNAEQAASVAMVDVGQKDLYEGSDIREVRDIIVLDDHIDDAFNSPYDKHAVLHGIAT